jgi:hypothetical protein
MYSVPTTDPVGISLPFTLSPAADIVDDLPAHLQETCFGSGLTTMYSALLSPVPVMVLSVGSVPASLSPRQMGLPVGQQIGFSVSERSSIEAGCSGQNASNSASLAGSKREHLIDPGCSFDVLHRGVSSYYEESSLCSRG